jgi:hypothetical protein
MSAGFSITALSAEISDNVSLTLSILSLLKFFLGFQPERTPLQYALKETYPGRYFPINPLISG